MSRNIVTRLFFCSVCGLVILTTLAGCKSSPPSTGIQTAGFLSDYSHLESISDTSHRYINPKYDIGNYKRFILDRVELLFQYGDKSNVKRWDDLEKLRSYTHRAMFDAISPEYKVVSQPGPGVARVRIALTNIESSSVFRLGGASMEFEILDSLSGEQIAAVIDSRQKRSTLVSEYGSYGKWEGAKRVVDAWAEQFYRRLREAHGLLP